MGRFYGLKITNGEISLEQVPKLWRTATENWILANQ